MLMAIHMVNVAIWWSTDVCTRVNDQFTDRFSDAYFRLKGDTTGIE